MSGKGGHEGELQRLGREVMETDAARLLRIVKMVDTLPQRGAADALIAPLRPRLAVLRPPRPATLTRLLFQPIDPLIVQPAAWRPGSPGVPRPLLAPLAAVALTALGDLAGKLQTQLARVGSLATPVSGEVGAVLWPRAADALRGWAPTAELAAASGIEQAALAPLVGGIATLLDQGAILYRLGQQPDAAGETKLAEMLLAAAARDGLAALRMMLALLLSLAPDAGHLLRLAEAVAPPGEAAVAQPALDFLLGGLAEVSGGGVPADAAAMRRAAALLEGMEHQGGQRTAHLAKLALVRRRLDGACRSRFEAAAETLERMLPAGGGAEPPDDTAMARMEAMALEVRRLEAVGRRVGGAGFDDAPMRRAAERLAAASALPAVDRLRLAEILLGPDAALALAERMGFALAD